MMAVVVYVQEFIVRRNAKPCARFSRYGTGDC